MFDVDLNLKGRGGPTCQSQANPWPRNSRVSSVDCVGVIVGVHIGGLVENPLKTESFDVSLIDGADLTPPPVSHPPLLVA
jgi:hypothetical protein